MIKSFKKHLTKFAWILFILFLISCKTDEFKFDEITIKEDFRIKLKSPLYTGKDKKGDILEFADFIYNWSKPLEVDTTLPYTVLEYENRTPRIIPTDLIFNRSDIIDSLAFLIDGEYELEDVQLVFNVANASPFDLNTEISFLINGIAGPPILPAAFEAADFARIPIVPVTSIDTVLLDSAQCESFMKSKRLKLTAWYNRNDFINQNDTLSAHYPIDYSIVLIGMVKAKNE